MARIITDIADPRWQRDYSDVDAECPINWSHPLNDSLVSFWLCLKGLNNGGSRTFFDLAHRNHGSLSTSIVYSAPLRESSGHGSLFCRDAGFGRVTVPDSPSLKGMATLTVIASCFPITSGEIGFGRLITKGDAGDYAILMSDTSGFQCFVGGTGAFTSSATGVGIETRIGFVYNGSNIQCYRNGIASGSAVSHSGSVPSNATDVIFFDRSSQDRPFDGYGDGFKIIARALSADEMKAENNDYLNGCSHTINWRRRPSYFIFPAGEGGTPTGTSALTASAQTLSATAEHDTPLYTGDSALQAQPQTLAATAEHDTPVYSGESALQVQQQTLAASALFAAEIYSGVATLTAQQQTLAADATFDEGTFTADASLIASSQTLAGTAEHDTPTYEATAALTAASQVLSADALFAAEIYQGVAALTAGQQVLAASAVHGLPTYEGNAELSTSRQTLSGSAEHVQPTYSGEAALAAASQQLTASAIYGDFVFTAVADFVVSNQTLSAAGDFTPIPVEYNTPIIVNVQSPAIIINTRNSPIIVNAGN
jgi:hypothetical protein